MSRLSTTEARSRTRLAPAPLAAVATCLVAVAAAALALGLVLADGAYAPPPAGLPDPGPIVGWGAPIARLLTDLAAITTVGFVLAAAMLDPSGRDGVVSREGRRDLRIAVVAAVVWAVLAVVQLFLVLANVLGMSLSQALDPVVASTYVSEIPSTRALLAMAVLALVVAVGLAVTSTVGSAAGWLALAVVAAFLPSLAGHGAGLGDHALALSSNVLHSVAAVTWIGGLLALAVHAARRSTSLRRPVERFSAIALTAFAAMALSGFANAYTRLESPEQLVTTGYGQVLLLKVVILGGLGVIAWTIRQRVIATLDRGPSRSGVFARVAGIELTLMAIAVALGVALASSPPPRVETQFATLGESLLGFAYPPPPTAELIAFGFRLDPVFLVGGLIAATLYCLGYARLRQRGDRWPVGRLISWLLGIGIAIWCTNAGIAVYSQVSVGLHMLQHMTLTMLAPILLVLGAPATLALRALKPASHGERGPREWLIWFLQSPITRVLTNPVYVFIVYVIGLYGLYLTPAFGWLMGSHVGHVLMQVHFVVSGYLFAWILIGIDPRPKPLPYWGRMIMLLLALGVHGFFAVIIMMGSQPLAPEWYGIVRPEWVVDPLQDTLFGGQVAWGLAEIPTIILIVVIAVQWSRADDREAVRVDRQADRTGDAELEAYNARFAQLAERDRR